MTQGPIGEAHVLVVPDLSRFPAELKAKLDAAFRAIRDPQIPVDPDLDRFSEKVKRETTRTERTTKAKVPVAPDLSRFEPEVRAFIARFDPKEQLKLAATLDRQSFAKVAAEAKALAKASAPKVEVEVDVDKHNFLKSLHTPHPELFQGLRAPLAAGLSTPVGLAIASTLATVLLVAIPSAIALSLGAGLAGLAAFALRGSAILKTHFKAAGAVISESLRQAAQPLKGPFLQAIETLSGAVVQLQPQFRALFAGLAPAIKPFVDGIAGFVRELLPNLQAAMPAINAAFAEFGARLPELGRTLGGVFAAISENLPAIQRGIGILFTLTEGILNVTGALLTLGQRASSAIANVGSFLEFVREHTIGLAGSQKEAAATSEALTNRLGEMAIADQKVAILKLQLQQRIELLTGKLQALKQEWDAQVTAVQGSIESYKGLITQSGVTAGQVVKDLHNQVANFRTYSKDVKRLIKEGVSPEAIQELSKKGPEFVHGLVTGTSRQLEDYKRTWKEKQAAVRGSFAESMELQFKALAKKIKAMQKEIDKLKGKTVDLVAQASVTAPKGTLLLIEKGLAARGVRVPGKAAGGLITEGGGPTADDVLVRVSRGETVVPAAASARSEFRAWARERRIPGFASGGQPAGDLDRFRAGIARTDRSFREVAIALGRSVLSALKTGLSSFLPGVASHAAGSWKAATNFLTQVGIPYSIVSTFRPGAVTHASGRQSYHALNRAVDLTGPNMLAIWKALLGTNPTELIYSRAPFYISSRGRRPIGQLDPITRADHFSHVHAAYDRGGLLMPGITVAHNRTGKPEKVTPATRDAAGRLSFGGQGTHIENLIVQPITGRFRLSDVMTEVRLQGVH